MNGQSTKWTVERIQFLKTIHERLVAMKRDDLIPACLEELRFYEKKLDECIEQSGEHCLRGRGP